MQIENLEILGYEVTDLDVYVEGIEVTIDGKYYSVSLDSLFSLSYTIETEDDPGDYPSNAGWSALPSESYPVCDGIEIEKFKIIEILDENDKPVHFDENVLKEIKELVFAEVDGMSDDIVEDYCRNN